MRESVILAVLYVESCSETIFTVALIKKNEEKEVGLHRCWICPPGRDDCEECLAGEREVGCLPVRWERRHNAGLEMVIAPTPRTAGVETLECFEAGNVICATVWGESGSITFVELHRQVLTSEMCEKCWLRFKCFHLIFLPSCFLSLSLALRSISQWPLISLPPMVRIFSVLIVSCFEFVLHAVG